MRYPLQFRSNCNDELICSWGEDGQPGLYSPLTRSAYRSVLSVCSQEDEFGETLAIITVLASSPVKESRSTCGQNKILLDNRFEGMQSRIEAISCINT